MNKDKYITPKIIINKVYTKSGDSGNTSLVGGEKISKSALRIKAFGEVDELITIVGSIIVFIENNCKNFKDLQKILQNIQHELFNLGNMLATLPSHFKDKMPRVDKISIKEIERNIDFYNKDLKDLTSFILPGGSELSIRCHIARTTTRRVERIVVTLSESENIDSYIVSYLNRLSDLFFVLSRWTNNILKKDEITWNSNFKK